MKPRSEIIFYLNGERQSIDPTPENSDASLMLADYLRRRKGLTGTKIVCAEGDCGACTVLQTHPVTGTFRSVNACILPLLLCDSTHIITIEGVAPTRERLHPVQSALQKHHATQCGYCTPGFVMSFLDYFENKPKKEKPTAALVKNHLTGNLCRCTGYQSIIDAGLAVADDPFDSVIRRHHTPRVASELKKLRAQSLELKAGTHTLLAPTKISELTKLRKKHPKARLLAGGTDLGVLLNKGRLVAPSEPLTFLTLARVSELTEVTFRKKASETWAEVGAGVTLSQVEKSFNEKLPELSRLLHVFASPQIKHIATLVGNVANGSPIGDTLPLLLALDGEVNLLSTSGKRTLPLIKLYRGYRDLAMKPGEWITAVRFRLPSKGAVLRAYKVSQRKDLDISFVSAAFLIESKAGHIQQARVAYGGMAAIPTRLPQIEKSLAGLSLEDSTSLRALAPQIAAEFEPRTDVRGTAEARLILAKNLYLKFLLEEIPPQANSSQEREA